MKLHVLSDLHLSVAPLEAPETDADVVILAGDIARPREAIEWAGGFAKPVLYVPGNHEFYGGSIPGTIRQLREHARASNVHVLDDDAVTIGGVRFLGTTLWSDFRLFGAGEARDVAIEAALRFVRDFTRIRIDDRSATAFTPAESAALFARHARWLESRLVEPFDGPTVVITHHAPSRQSTHSRFADSPLNVCFVSDAEELVGTSGAALWIHGHTHDSFDYVVGATRVVCNPRGYAKNGVNENVHFDPRLVLEVGVRHLS
jgi:predicted phosphodiesterase